MIETFKYTNELQRDSSSNNIHIAVLLEEARQIFNNIFFIESVIIKDKGFFHTKTYQMYSLYTCKNYKDKDIIHDVKIINLNNDGIGITCYEERDIILYLKGLCDGYKLTKTKCKQFTFF